MHGMLQAALAAKALQFVILTGTRSGEVFGMTFDEIDFETSTWTVPVNRMKMGREHSVPLSEQALALLKDQLAERGPKQDHVFESPLQQSPKLHRSGAHQPLSPMALVMLMRRLHTGVTTHGMRSSFRSWSADFEVAEQCLAHGVGNAVVQAYQRSSMLERRRPVMTSWAQYLAGKAEPKAVPIGSRRKETAR